MATRFLEGGSTAQGQDPRPRSSICAYQWLLLRPLSWNCAQGAEHRPNTSCMVEGRTVSFWPVLARI